MSRNQSRGRIYANQRNTNDVVDIIGDDIEVGEEQAAGVLETEQQDRKMKTKIDLRNRLRHIMEYWKEYHPQYYSAGVIPLTEEKLCNSKYFYHKNKHDLVYTGLNVTFVKLFLNWKKQKANRKIASYVQIRKYHDAILFGSSEAGEPLPRQYYEDMERFLKGFKKQAAAAKSEGQLDEQDADPISWSFFQKILSWSIASRNIFVWTYSLLQWNLMARSVNISNLALHNFKVGEDCLIGKYDKTKSDQTGEKVHGKHIYANPLNPLANCFLALGIYMWQQSTRFERTERLFVGTGLREESGSERYCTQLAELFAQNNETVKAYIRSDHANSHGLRKGSATAVSSGTTCPPPISSIAARGEWSIGKVLDIYWHFAEPGDTYLGRCLAGLDPNSVDFSVLPPHFIVDNPLSYDFVKEAMQLMFGPILSRWSNTAVDPTGLLLLLLPNIVYHIDWVMSMIRKFDGHPFSAIPLVNRQDLLVKLSSIVSCSPGGLVHISTGIPPHVEHAIQMKRVIQLCIQTLGEVKVMSENVRSAVNDAIEEKALENGHLTGQRFLELMDAQQNDMKQFVSDRLDEMQSSLQASSVSDSTVQRIPNEHDHEQSTSGNHNNNSQVSSIEFVDGTLHPRASAAGIQPQFYGYSWGGGFWQVPESFSWPTGIRLLAGWTLWIRGMPGYEVPGASDGTRRKAPIRPYRLLDKKMLPPLLKKQFGLHWEPIFSMMELTPNLGIPQNPNDISSEFISSSCELARDFLKTRIRYVFNKDLAKPENWEISTWSKHAKRSEIVKHGTLEDINALPPENSKNRQKVMLQRRRQPEFDRRRKRRVAQRRMMMNGYVNDDPQDAPPQNP